MKKLKILILTLIFLVGNYLVVLADITNSSRSNMIQTIASRSSFTSLDNNSVNSRNITNNLLDSKRLQSSVNTGAKAFGKQLNEKATQEQEEQFVTLNGKKEAPREFPEPNLDTIVYDTGLMTLAANTSAQYNGGAGDDTNIFSGTQKARVKVYIDFVRQKQWGSVESHITLTNENNGEKMENVFEGGARTVTKLPVESGLVHTISSATTKPLRIDENIMPEFDNDETPFPYDPHSIESFLKDNTTPTLAPYDLGGFPDLDLADMQKSISHGTGGDKDVLVTAKFSTGVGGTLGTSTAAFEISKVGKCASADGCTADEVEAIKTSIVRLEATATTTASKYTPE